MAVSFRYRRKWFSSCRRSPLPQHQAPDTFLILKSRNMNKRVTLNVGGVRWAGDTWIS